MLTSIASPHPTDLEELRGSLTPGTQEGGVALEPAQLVEEGRVEGRVGGGWGGGWAQGKPKHRGFQERGTWTMPEGQGVRGQGPDDVEPEGPEDWPQSQQGLWGSG